MRKTKTKSVWKCNECPLQNETEGEKVERSIARLLQECNRLLHYMEIDNECPDSSEMYACGIESLLKNVEELKKLL